MKLSGVFAAMVTPFTDDGSALSEERINGYCAFLIGHGIQGLFAFGSTGEWPLLSDEERTAGTQMLLRYVQAKVPVIIHTGAHSTERAIRLSVHARSSGAAAVSIISPPFYTLDEQALFDHFSTLAREVSGFPVFIYNIPEFTNNDVSPELLLRIAKKADNVVGIKYSGDSLPRLREYRQKMGQEFSLFNGNDSLALPALHEGADGLVSGNASAYPEAVAGLYSLFRQGRFQEAHKRQLNLDEIIRCRDSSCELSSFKAILSHRGVEVGDVRRPLKRLAEEGKAELGAQVTSLEGRGVIS